MAVSAFVPEVWHATILANFRDRSVLSNTVATEYEGTARFGNVVHVTQFATPDVVDYATGNGDGARTVTPQELTATGQAIEINREKAFAFYVGDIDRRQAAGTMNPITHDAALALREDSEAFIAATLTTDGTEYDGERAATDGNSTFDLVRDLRTRLSRVDAPNENRFLAVNPEFAALLLGADSKLTEVDTSGTPAGLREATIGRLLGFQVVETNHLTQGAPACVAYHRSAFGFVNQLEKVEAVRDTRRFADIIRGLMVSGGKVLRPEAVISYEYIQS